MQLIRVVWAALSFDRSKAPPTATMQHVIGQPTSSQASASSEDGPNGQRFSPSSYNKKTRTHVCTMPQQFMM